MAIKQLEGLGEIIFRQRYAANSTETWGQRAKVIARDAASVENDDNREKWEKKFYDTIGSADFVPGGRIIYGAGRANQNRLNCYSLIPEDSVESLGKLLHDTYKISCGGGGIGFNISHIRPKGDDIQNIKNSAPGSISVLRLLNAVGDHVRAGRNRRTALLAILAVDHPDILEFLHVKLDKKELNNFNISVGITDEFLDACKSGANWDFKFNGRTYNIYQIDRKTLDNKTETINVVGTSPEDATSRAYEHYRNHSDDIFENAIKYELKAKELWDKIWENSVDAGCPGIFNLSLVKRFTNVDYVEGPLECCNPCSEANLSHAANCTLGQINLTNMLSGTEVDWSKLANTIRVGVRFLDNILTLNPYPIPESKEAAMRTRRIGLGFMGLHHMLIRLGLRYGSEKCIEFLERLFATIRNEAYLASVYLGEEKGSFQAFNAEKFLNEEFAKSLPARIRMLIKKKGIRNAILQAIAPTGTISMVFGLSSGIEPIFAPMYLRRYRVANVIKEEVVVDPLFNEYAKNGTSIDELTKIFVGSQDITPEEHMIIQATAQRFVCQSISKTINLPPTTKASEFSEIALNYAPYLKGMTIYRENSKSNQPLSVIPLTEENIKKYIIDNKEISSVGVEEANFCIIGDGSCGA